LKNKTSYSRFLRDLSPEIESTQDLLIKAEKYHKLSFKYQFMSPSAEQCVNEVYSKFNDIFSFTDQDYPKRPAATLLTINSLRQPSIMEKLDER